MNQTMEIITVITALLNALAWPVVALFVIVRLTPSLIQRIDGGTGFSVKGFGFEATFANSVAEAAVALGAAEAKKAAEAAAGELSQDGQSPHPARVAVPSAHAVANTVTKLVPDARAQRSLQGATVLWVDDNPDNNRLEREAFQAMGIRFELSTSTDDALRQLGRHRFEAVISDMGRGQDRDAGYELLERLRQTDPSTPFFIYAGPGAVRHRDEALARGAQGSTSSPQELMTLVFQAIQGQRRR